MGNHKLISFSMKTLQHEEKNIQHRARFYMTVRNKARFEESSMDDASADKLMSKIAEICENINTKKRFGATEGKLVYWWNDIMGALRKEYQLKRRKYPRARKTQSNLASITEEYKDAK
ncbi:hypothetical protein HHI36_017676 [Cryptolaemus montrouzieri]|uniref:Uncharacterized protein n=1 Tax=Cryptolaemus montrouzieri TaxID=559131 RepID=A0ABD2NN36_9CUCU